MRVPPMSRLHWSPYVLPSPWMVVAMSASSLFAAAFRGLDYLILPQADCDMTGAEILLSTREWGVLLMVGVALCAFGYLVHRWPVTILGHALLAGVFLTFGVMNVLDGAHHIHTAELRIGVAFLCVQTMLHAQLVLVSWWRWDAARE